MDRHKSMEERASRFTKRSIKKETKLNGLKLVLNMIDLTTLEGKDTDGKVKQLCYKAMHLHDALPGLPTVAAICVYPSMVKVAKKALGDSGINVASVATEATLIPESPNAFLASFTMDG